MLRNALRSWLALALLVCAGSLPLAARAVDGRIEINQCCAAVGCFAGDGAGFPVTTVTATSYVLTSDLVVPDADTTAILLSAHSILDLNGFAIRGPVVCNRSSSYDATTTTCSPSGSGSGVSTPGATIRNGRIGGMGAYAIADDGDTGNLAHVEDVHVDDNGLGGILIKQGTVRNVEVTQNGGAGVSNSASGASGIGLVIEDSIIMFNQGNGISTDARIVDNTITYNGGAGILHDNAGGKNSLIAGNSIERNKGKAINAYGTYRDNEIYANDAVGGQVIGGMTDAGGNRVH